MHSTFFLLQLNCVQRVALETQNDFKDQKNQSDPLPYDVRLVDGNKIEYLPRHC